MQQIKANVSFSIPAFLKRAFAFHAELKRVVKEGSTGKVTAAGAEFFAGRTCNMEEKELIASLKDAGYSKGKFDGTPWAVNKKGDHYPVACGNEGRTLFYHALISLTNGTKIVAKAKATAKAKTPVHVHVKA